MDAREGRVAYFRADRLCEKGARVGPVPGDGVERDGRRGREDHQLCGNHEEGLRAAPGHADLLPEVGLFLISLFGSNLKFINHEFNGQFERSETHHGRFEFTTAHLHEFDSCLKLYAHALSYISGITHVQN